MLIEITFFVCNNRISLFGLRPSSDRLVIFVKEFLSLSNLLRPTKHGVTSRALGSHGFR